MKIVLIVGLGNPGKKFEKTRHNAGFMFVDYFWKNFRDEFGFSEWEFKKKLNAEISVGNAGSKKIILAKPRTFMNLSGKVIAAAKKYYKIRLENIIVVHDEIDLPLGNYKFSTNSSSAGHKGAQNIINALGTQNFMRLRIGVDNRKNKRIATEKYVLGKFTNTELAILKKTLEDSSNDFWEKIKNKNIPPCGIP